MLKISESTPIALIYKPNTGETRTVVSFPKGIKNKPQFGEKDKFLESAMRTVGIPIPFQHKENYPELLKDSKRQSIYLEDESFGKAFYEIYFPEKMNPNVFKWKKI